MLFMKEVQETVVAFVNDLVPFTTELSFVLNVFRAALFSFRVFNFLTKADLSCLKK